MPEVFRIKKEDGEWKLEGEVRDDARELGMLILSSLEAAERKISHTENLEVEI